MTAVDVEMGVRWIFQMPVCHHSVHVSSSAPIRGMVNLDKWNLAQGNETQANNRASRDRERNQGDPLPWWKDSTPHP